MKVVQQKLNKDIAKEWDDIANLRKIYIEKIIYSFIIVQLKILIKIIMISR